MASALTQSASTPPNSTTLTLVDSDLCPSAAECEFPGLLELFGINGLSPHQRLVMTIRVPVPSGFEGPLEIGAKIAGGGALPAEATATNEASR